MHERQESSGLSSLRPAYYGGPRLVTIIIPALDVAHVIADQLEALSVQAYSGDWEVIVADNGSKDATAEVALQWASKFRKLRVVCASDRRGVNFARNVGAAAADGDFLLFCDADDVAAPGWLQAMADSAPAADIVGGYADYELLNEPRVRGWRPPQPRRELRTSMRFLPYAIGASLGVWTRVLSSLGGFNEDYTRRGDDIEFCWRAQLALHVVQFAPDAVMHYRLREELGSLARQAFAAGRADAQLARDFRVHGMPATDVRAAAKRWLDLFRRLPDAITPHEAGDWVYWTTRSLGRLVGSIHYRVLCL